MSDLTETSPLLTGKPTVMGVGNAGVHAIATLAALPGSEYLTKYAIDTDLRALAACPLPEEQKILVDRQWRNGAGTGGNVTNAQRSMSRERVRLEGLVGEASWLIVLCGIGGGTGTAGAQALAGIARRLKIPAVFMLTFPFSLEGHGKRRIADDAIKDLLPIVDVLLCLPNDLLFSTLPTDTPVLQAFELADRELAKAALGLADLLKGGSLMPADFAMLSDALKERKSFCGIGVGTADAADSLNMGHQALERMMDSPLLGGVAKLKEADVVLLSLTGGPKLSIGDVTRCFEAAERFINPDGKLIVGANLIPDYGDRMQLVALAVKYDGREASDPALADYRQQVGKPAKTAKGREKKAPAMEQMDFEQQLLPLETVSRGIFHKSAPTIYNGEDLDIPTWQRREIHIDLGE